MSSCPVCGNREARVTTQRRIPGGAGASWFVKCPVCPVPFEISGPSLSEAARNPRQYEARRRQWSEFLRGAAERGDKLARLY